MASKTVGPLGEVLDRGDVANQHARPSLPLQHVLQAFGKKHVHKAIFGLEVYYGVVFNPGLMRLVDEPVALARRGREKRLQLTAQVKGS
ncbi:hypothetical protein [Bradyrhizobium sp. RDT46]|uniref:hypothetical protein n=1 Tax=Bradyrhizobium sp. RDT46 TaxID=3341829 RepID=UPI0035C68AB5